MARRWVDGDILAKMGLGAVLTGVSTYLWSVGRIWPWGWVVGVGSFLWGLLSIGDKKSEWE
jgi:hypothetical protein